MNDEWGDKNNVGMLGRKNAGIGECWNTGIGSLVFVVEVKIVTGLSLFTWFLDGTL